MFKYPPTRTILNSWFKLVQADEQDAELTAKIAETIAGYETTDGGIEYAPRFFQAARYITNWEQDQDPALRLYTALTDAGVAASAVKIMESRINMPLTDYQAQSGVKVAEELKKRFPDYELKDLVWVTTLAGDKALEELDNNSQIESLEELAQRFSPELNFQPSIFPNVIEGERATRDSIRAKFKDNLKGETTKKSEDNYSTGKESSDSLVTSGLDVDDMAQDLLLQGASMEDVTMFHDQAPEGYWEDVVKLVEEDGVDTDDAYLDLMEKYSFHPSHRDFTGDI